jgi:hypothetical protein
MKFTAAAALAVLAGTALAAPATSGQKTKRAGCSSAWTLSTMQGRSKECDPVMDSGSRL